MLVPVDFERQGLGEELLGAGFDLHGAVTATSWLGVVPYLTLEAFRSTVTVARERCRRARAWCSTNGQPREVLPEREQRMRDSMASRVADAGEPFRLFFTPETVAAELREAGLSVVEDLGGPALTERYLAGRGRWAAAQRPVR